MKPKFKIDDRVIYKPCKLNGSVINRYRTTGICAVVLDEDGISHYINENDLEFEDPKLAFLTRLQELLATFDAYIYTDKMDALYIGIGDDIHLKWIFRGKGINGAMLTSERVFNHDND